MAVTQEQKVKNWLDSHEYIDRYIAMNNLHIANITAVISTMKQHGIDVITVEKTSANGIKYARWEKGENYGEKENV